MRIDRSRTLRATTLLLFGYVLAASPSSATAQTATSAAGMTATGQFNGVSCNVAICVAVGSWRPNERAVNRQLATSSQGSSWTVLPTPAYSNSYLNAVSCVSLYCLLVGERENRSLHFVLTAEKFNNSGKVTDTMPPTPLGDVAADYTSVSCLSVSFCMAVAETESSPDVNSGPLAMRFDGSKWSATPIIGLPTKGVVLASVSCVPKAYLPSGSCQAVGWYQTASGRSAPLALAWNGSKWIRERAANPRGSMTANRLESVSCHRTFCLAVGASLVGHSNGMDSKAGKYHQSPLSERLVNDSALKDKAAYRWQNVKHVPKPGVASAVLTGVSCPFINFCEAAGTYYDVKRQAWRSLIEAWRSRWFTNGAGCTGSCIHKVPDVRANKNVLTDVSCYFKTDCIAVGHTITVGPIRTTEPLAIENATTDSFDWHLLPAPRLSG